MKKMKRLLAFGLSLAVVLSVSGAVTAQGAEDEHAHTGDCCGVAAISVSVGNEDEVIVGDTELVVDGYTFCYRASDFEGWTEDEIIAFYQSVVDNTNSAIRYRKIVATFYMITGHLCGPGPWSYSLGPREYYFDSYGRQYWIRRATCAKWSLCGFSGYYLYVDE